jgi:SAM-dependent methyltransferase
VTDLVADLRCSMDLRSAIDVGCGVGYFSELLQSSGFQVSAVDGRAENVEEASRRHKNIEFHQFNAEDSKLAQLGTFDLCFCFGLLYHLENPFLAIRILRALTKTLLLIEGVTFPGNEPIMALIDEECLQDQGLHHFAFYPTEACLIKMFYRAGFARVYALTSQPEHPEYHSSPEGRRTRTILVASLVPIQSKKLQFIPEPASDIRPWDPTSGIEVPQTVQRLRRFAGKPFAEKIESLKRVVKKPKEK